MSNTILEALRKLKEAQTDIDDGDDWGGEDLFNALEYDDFDDFEAIRQDFDAAEEFTDDQLRAINLAYKKSDLTVDDLNKIAKAFLLKKSNFRSDYADDFAGFYDMPTYSAAHGQNGSVDSIVCDAISLKAEQNDPDITSIMQQALQGQRKRINAADKLAQEHVEKIGNLVNEINQMPEDTRAEQTAKLNKATDLYNSLLGNRKFKDIENWVKNYQGEDIHTNYKELVKLVINELSYMDNPRYEQFNERKRSYRDKHLYQKEERIDRFKNELWRIKYDLNRKLNG